MLDPVAPRRCPASLNLRTNRNLDSVRNACVGHTNLYLTVKIVKNHMNTLIITRQLHRNAVQFSKPLVHQ